MVRPVHSAGSSDPIDISNDGWLFESAEGKNATSGTVQYLQGVIADGAVGVDYPWSMFVTMVQTDYADIQEDYIDPSDAAIR